MHLLGKFRHDKAVCRDFRYCRDFDKQPCIIKRGYFKRRCHRIRRVKETGSYVAALHKRLNISRKLLKRYDIAHPSAKRLKNVRDVLQNLSDLYGHVALADNLSIRVKRHLPFQKYRFSGSGDYGL